MFLLNQPISGRYFKIFVEFLCSQNSGVDGAVRTLRQPKIGVYTKRYTLRQKIGTHPAAHLTPN
jgi:hypothetical protein